MYVKLTEFHRENKVKLNWRTLNENFREVYNNLILLTHSIMYPGSSIFCIFSGNWKTQKTGESFF